MLIPLYNAYGISYPKRQKFLFKPFVHTWYDLLLEIPQEKKNSILKRYKILIKKDAKILKKKAKILKKKAKILKKKGKKGIIKGKLSLIQVAQKNLRKSTLLEKSVLEKSVLEKSLGKGQILSLNFNLTKKNPQNLYYLSKAKTYALLKTTNLKVKRHGGYTKYHDKVFFSE